MPAEELASRLASNKELLERLIHNTSVIIDDQRRHWFPQQPSPIDVLRQQANEQGRSVSPRRSVSLTRRPPDRDVTSPPPQSTIRHVSPHRRHSPPSITRSPSSPWPRRTMSPTMVVSADRPDASPELAPPLPYIPPGFPPASPVRVPEAHAALPRSRATHRLVHRLEWSAKQHRRARAFIAWMGFTILAKTRIARRPVSSVGDVRRLEEALRLAQADIEVAQARAEAAEARADKHTTRDVSDRRAKAERDQLLSKLQRCKEDAAAQLRTAALEAEDSRGRASAAMERLNEARTELERMTQQCNDLVEGKGRLESRALDLELRLQACSAEKGKLQADLASQTAMLEQREREVSQLRDDLRKERGRIDKELILLQGRHAKDIDSALLEQRRSAEAKVHSLLQEMEGYKRDLAEAKIMAIRLEEAATDCEISRTRADKLQSLLNNLRNELSGSAQTEAMLRDQLEGRTREVEALHADLRTSRVENARLQDRIDAAERDRGRMVPHHAVELREHSDMRHQARLEDALRERASAAASAEAQLLGSNAMIAKLEGENEGKLQRIAWLEDEVHRQHAALEELRKQVAELRAEKDILAREAADCRTAAAAADAQRNGALEKAAIATASFEQARCEALDARCQLTEVRSQLATTLARLEGREDLIMALREELARTREQLLAAEHLLSEAHRLKARTADENGAAQRAAEEKQRLIEHLESRIRALTDTLADRDRELADLRKKVDDLMAMLSRKDLENEKLSVELRGALQENERLKAEVKELQGRGAGMEELRDEIAKLRMQLGLLEERNKAAMAQITELQRKLEDVHAELARKNMQVDMLTEELQKQIKVSEQLGKAADASARQTCEKMALLGAESVKLEEAEGRLEILRGSWKTLGNGLQRRISRWRRMMADLLTKKNKAAFLMRYWSALHSYGALTGGRRARSAENERDLLTSALADLHGVVKAQARKTSALQSLLNKQRKKCAVLLRAKTFSRHLARGYHALVFNYVKKKLTRHQLRERRLKNALAQLLLTKTRAKHLFCRWVALSRKRVKEKPTIGKPQRSSLQVRRANARALSKWTTKTLLHRYFAKWLRWRQRRRQRRLLPALLRRNQNLLRRRAFVALMKNATLKLREALNSGSNRVALLRTKAHRRYQRSRLSAANALATAAKERLMAKYLNRWRAGWQDGRLRGMASRLQKIERLLLQGSQLERHRMEEEIDTARTRMAQKMHHHDADLSRRLEEERNRFLRLAQASEGQSVAVSINMLEMEESMDRMDIQRQEALSAYRIGLFAADLRNSSLAAQLLRSEVTFAFKQLQLEEQRRRMSIANDHLRGHVALLEELLGEVADSSGGRRVGQAEVERLRGQVSALRDQLASMTGDREALLAKYKAACGRCEGMEGEVAALREKQARLVADKEQLVNQLDATAAHLADTKNALLDLREQRSAMLAERDGMARQLGSFDSRTSDLQERVRDLQDRLAQKEVQHAAAQAAANEHMSIAEGLREELGEATSRLNDARAEVAAAGKANESLTADLQNVLRDLEAERIRAASQKDATLVAAQQEIQSVLEKAREDKELLRSRLESEAASKVHGTATLQHEITRLTEQIGALDRSNAVLKEENDQLRKVVHDELAKIRAEADGTAMEQAEAITRLEMDRDELAGRYRLLASSSETEIEALKGKLRLHEMGLAGPVSPFSPPVHSLHALLQDLCQQQESRREMLCAVHAHQDLIAEDDACGKFGVLEDKWQDRIASPSFSSLPLAVQEQATLEHEAAIHALRREVAEGKQARLEMQRDEERELEGAFAEEQRHLVAMATSRRRRFDQMQQQLSERQEAATQCRAKVDRLEDAWLEFTATSQFKSMSPVQQADAMRQHQHEVSRAITNGDEQLAALDEAHSKAHHAFESGTREQEREARQVVKAGRSRLLAVAHRLELLKIDHDVATRVNRITDSWRELKHTQAISGLRPGHQEEAHRRHFAELQHIEADAAAQRRQANDRHERELQQLEAVLEADEAKMAEAHNKRDSLLAKHSVERRAAFTEAWMAFTRSQRDWESRRAQPSFTALPHAEQYNARRCHVEVVSDRWRKYEQTQRRLLEQHHVELAQLDEGPPGTVALRSQEAPLPSMGDWPAHERLAFVLNTRGKLVSFITDSYRSLINTRKSLCQVADLFLMLPISKHLHHAETAPLLHLINLKASEKVEQLAAAEPGSPRLKLTGTPGMVSPSRARSPSPRLSDRYLTSFDSGEMEDYRRNIGRRHVSPSRAGSPHSEVTEVSDVRSGRVTPPARSSQWKKLASLETRSSSLRRQAAKGPAKRRDEDDSILGGVSKQRVLEIVERLEFCLGALFEQEVTLRHLITHYLTETEKHHLGINGHRPVAGDRRHLDLRTLRCSREERKIIAKVAHLLIEP